MSTDHGVMRVYWDTRTKNFGDVLTPVILKHLGFELEHAKRTDEGKVLAIGSVMNALRPRDVVWGTGVQFDRRYQADSVKFLAVRGPITRSSIDGALVPAVFGDPGLLLPEVYDPHVTVSHEVGVMPHRVDIPEGRRRYPDALFIDVTGGWRRVIRQMKSCKTVITTSLHGIVAADAYGIPVVWEASYSGDIISRNLKFQDYFLGTRGRFVSPGPVSPLHPDEYARLCSRLKDAASQLPA